LGGGGSKRNTEIKVRDLGKGKSSNACWYRHINKSKTLKTSLNIRRKKWGWNPHYKISNAVPKNRNCRSGGKLNDETVGRTALGSGGFRIEGGGFQVKTKLSRCADLGRKRRASVSEMF